MSAPSPLYSVSVSSTSTSTSSSSSSSPLALLGFVFSLLASLLFQIILTLFGSFRKRYPKKWFTFVLWLSYQLTDVATTTGLGIVLSGLSRNSVIRYVAGDAVLMSSFLLLHLGGPDSVLTISLVDKELRNRHLLQLIYRFGVAIYIHIKAVVIFTEDDSFDGTWLSIALLMLFAGMSKYGERSWAIRLASLDSLRDSMLPKPNPGPKTVGHNDAQSIPIPTDEQDQLDSNEAILLRGHHYFMSFRYLFVDLTVPDPHSLIDGSKFFLQRPCEVAFQLIDVELRFMYDMLFTKIPVIRTRRGFILRIFRFSAILYSLIRLIRIQPHDVTNIFFHFFTWAIVQETYELIGMLLSEWTVVWLYNHKLNWLSKIILKLILSCRLLVSLVFTCGCRVGRVTSEKTRNWWYNNIMAQYNLLSFCFKDVAIQKLVDNKLNPTYMDVHNDIKDFIYQQFRSSNEELQSAESRNPRGKWVMEKNNCVEELSWSVEVGFDQSVLIWHVATDLCYYHDDLDSNEHEVETPLQVKVSRALSNYLIYLLVALPFMLNSKIGKIRIQDTCARVKMLFPAPKGRRLKFHKLISFVLHKKKSSPYKSQEKDWIMGLLGSEPNVLVAEESKSVLFKAHKLSKLLITYTKEKRWEILSGVWVEMLSYAASTSSGKHHAQRLCDGGEFLTKIWLLKAHLDMID